MLNFKKIAAAVCAIALSVTTFVVPTVSAAESSGVTVSLSSGVTAVEAVPVACTTYISLNMDGVQTDYKGTTDFTNAGNIAIKVTKGVFSAASAKTTTYQGLLLKTTFAAPNWTVQFNNTEFDDYDLISVQYATNGVAGVLYGAGTRALEIGLAYTDAIARGDAVFEVLDSTYDPLLAITMCDDTGATTKPAATYASSGVKYSLASGTNVITEVEDGPTEVIPTATTTGKQNGVKIGDGYEGDTDATDEASAVAVSVLGDGNVYDELLWEVTADIEGEAVTKKHVSTVNVEGNAAYKFGLVIQGLAQSAITAITAVLQ